VELVLWQGLPVATSITGGVATYMSMYGDLLDNDVSAGEMWKNAAIYEEGLKPWKLFL
jgi:hypothetical protein